jgi:hypothetical protein
MIKPSESDRLNNFKNRRERSAQASFKYPRSSSSTSTLSGPRTLQPYRHGLMPPNNENLPDPDSGSPSTSQVLGRRPRESALSLGPRKKPLVIDSYPYECLVLIT